MGATRYERTFQWGSLLTREICLLVGTCDKLINEGYEDFSVVDTYAPGHPNPDDHTDWWSQPHEQRLLVCITRWQSNIGNLRCILSREGWVRLYGAGGNPAWNYQIPEAGVFGDAASGFGYVNRIRAVGDQLYVCGHARQFYRFDWDGRSLESGRWVDMAGPMRQPALDEPPGTEEGEGAFDAWLDASDETVEFTDLDGSGPDDVYAVGDESWHWDGVRWARLELPTDESIHVIRVLDRENVWMAGQNGTVLQGNARDGFVDRSGIEDNQNFIGLEWFEDKLFLASNLGLFTYDPATGKIAPYASGLNPELQDTHVLEAKDGTLWSIGFKDLAYFDGQRWTRVDHPDNPPIR